MYVKDIILKACDFTENDELGQALRNNGELSNELEQLKERLLKCFNLVRNEIVSEYMPIRKIVKVCTDDGRVDFALLGAKVVDIVSVRDNCGKNLIFKTFDNYLQTRKGEVEIEINIFPDELGYDDEFNSTLPERVYAYGVVREYCFIQTLYEDAEIWDQRFKNSIESFLRKKGNTFLPRRRWI